MAAKPKITFLAFFLMWAERQRWAVPNIHIRACHWLETRGDLAVLRCFRGFGKSTLLAVYNAWRYYNDPTFRILHQSESDPTAYKTSRDTKNVIAAHPLTAGMLREGEVEQWWVHGATDARNASMYAKGILSNVTSARADECEKMTGASAVLPPRQPQPASTLTQLVVVAPESLAGRTFPLGAGEVTIGRSSACTIALDDAFVSTQHARVFADPASGWVVEDTGSTNGTWINGQRLGGAHHVRSGDRLGVGGVVAEFR
jgi:hypothetical protein